MAPGVHGKCAEVAGKRGGKIRIEENILVFVVRMHYPKWYLFTLPEKDNRSTHHLSCKPNQSNWTTRHNLIRDEFADRIKEVNCLGVQKEVVAGKKVVVGKKGTKDIRADIVATIDGQPEVNFDVSVLALDRKGTPLVYPTDYQIRRAIEEEKAHHRHTVLRRRGSRSLWG